MIERYAEILQKWAGAKYSDNAFEKYRIANCLKFVASVFDELHGFDPPLMPEVPSLPAQTSKHNRLATLRVHRWMENRYPHTVIYRPKNGHTIPLLASADIVTTHTGRNPGHVLIVGPDSRFIWHCMTGCGVQKTSLAWCLSNRIFRVYRTLLMSR